MIEELMWRIVCFAFGLIFSAMILIQEGEEDETE